MIGNTKKGYIRIKWEGDEYFTDSSNGTVNRLITCIGITIAIIARLTHKKDPLAVFKIAQAGFNKSLDILNSPDLKTTYIDKI